MALHNRISDLPDELLCHILSFLPTNLAFNTTLLSERWYRLLYSLYSLDVLRFDHRTFKNSYNFRCFVNNLMLSPLSTNKPLKTFHLECFVNSNMHINSWLESANWRGVEELRLNLHLHTLKNNILISRNDYINFLSACPILQDLDAHKIFYRKHDESNAPEERFKSLTLSKLVRASINSRHAIFNVVKNVEFLSITTIDKEFSFKVIPMFQNLMNTELVFGYGSIHCWDTVVELLQHSPKLQNICIRKRNSSSQEWKYPSSIPECVSSHLRSCTILDFDGSANDLRFARYVLQNASLLENMKIGFNNGMLLEKSQIVKELSSCPRISPSCILSFGDK